eukprot:TRINITY_DN36_c0_g1_i2.p1 TRINITY_DN36_c0_g1~~TRINITY_DN36_c0_g1_i2.p1  ORF type:complete len:598 (+),score=192.98 TRINITY_DN36_c0_g1_i2:118-1794(+)
MQVRSVAVSAPQPRRGSSGGSNAAAIGGVLVLFVAIFVASYRYGSGQPRDEGSRRSTDLRKRGDYLRDGLKACQAKAKKSQQRTADLKGESASLWKSNRQLEEENERLVRMNEDLEKKSIECVENSEIQKQAWSDEDQKTARVLTELDRRNKALRIKAKRLSSVQGMRTILLLGSIKKLAEENRRLRQRLDLPVVEPSDEYVSGLVTKWRKLDRTLADASDTGGGDLLQGNASDFSQLLRRPRVDYQLDERHASKIFFQQRGPDGRYVKPSWHGRVGTPPLQHGALIGSQGSVAVLSITRQLRVLYEYALCAMANNITKFMYPTAFRATAKHPPEQLHDFLETPLVAFCDDCRTQHSSPEFKLLCQGYSSEDQYGSFLFWRMRSRLRFKANLLEAADKWVQDHGFQGLNKTLAVRLKRGDFQEKCPNHYKNGRPQLSYLRLLKGRVKELSTEFDAQCYPGTAHVARSINAICAEKDIERVYLSTDTSRQELDALRGMVKTPIVVRPNTGNKTRDSVVDVIVASRMRYLLLNRFDIASTHMAEYFLLENRLRSSRITVW